MQKLTVTVHDHGCAKKINPGFQNPQRPAWYLATQEAIVPREPLFARIASDLIARFAGLPRAVRVFEPGVGVGSLFHFLLTRTELAARCELHLIGADLSEEMVRLCRHWLSEVALRPGWKPVTLELHARVDLLSLGGAGIERILEQGPFDGVVASQFEHSYPNHSGSPLALKLANDNIQAGTKHKFRQFVWEHLRPGGLYWAVDDYLTGDWEQDQRQTLAWDAAVVHRLADPAFTRGLAAHFPRVAASIERRFHPALGEELLLNKVAHARQRRRFLCNEETERLPDALADLQSLFGPERVDTIVHPSAAHRQFHLLRAERVRE